MDLSTTYLGLKLSNPVMPGASPLADDLDVVKRLEDHGASAIVMHSLFEEQLASYHYADIYHREIFANSFAEAQTYFPEREEYALGPERYLDQIRKIKKAVSVPVIASLNGTSPGGWIDYAKQIQQAGADALELNIYHISTDPVETSNEIEARLIQVVQAVRKAVTIPLAVKLSPFFSSLPNLCCQLQDAGANGIILFNRFYQPDIDLEQLDAVPRLSLSDASDLHLRLRWLAIVSPHVDTSLAVSGGVHTGIDAVKAVMAGAHAVQVVSALLRYGPAQLGKIIGAMKQWMDENEYTSMRRMHGSMNMGRCPDAGAFERGNYMRILHSWKRPQW